MPKLVLIVTLTIAASCVSPIAPASTDEAVEMSVLIGERKYGEALHKANLALARDPSNKQLHHARGHIHLQLGNYGKALLDLNACEPPDAKNAVALYNSKANAYVFLKRYREAVSEYDRALRQCSSGEYPRILSNRAVALLYMGDGTAALRDVSQAIKLSPRHKSAYINRAEIRYRLGNFQQCLEDAQTGISLLTEGNAGEGYYWKSMAERKLGRLDAAERDAKTALRLGYKPNSIQIVQHDDQKN